jgi:hypothetical protein
VVVAKIDIVRSGEMSPLTGYGAPAFDIVGGARSRRAGPPGYSIWLVSSEVDRGASLRWRAGHGDEAVYVKRGSLEVDGRSCAAGGALIVEADAALEALVVEPSEFLHFGSVTDTPVERKPAGGPARGYHLVGPRGVYAREDPTHVTRIFADASCPTCDAFLLHSSRTVRYRSAAHSHTQDELIHLLDGDISLGSHRLDPGDTLTVTANTRYRFEAGDQGYAFLNFSAAKSGYVLAPGESGEHLSSAPLVYTGDGADYAEPVGGR